MAWTSKYSRGPIANLLTTPFGSTVALLSAGFVLSFTLQNTAALSGYGTAVHCSIAAGWRSLFEHVKERWGRGDDKRTGWILTVFGTQVREREAVRREDTCVQPFLHWLTSS